MENVYVANSNMQGKGVFAAVHFNPADEVLRIDDSRVVTDKNPLQEGEEEYHQDYIGDKKIVLMQSPERYINHSCNPNTYVKTIAGERRVIARRPIELNEEITYDYSINGLGDYVWQCNCGSEHCRKSIHSSFFKLPPELQCEYLPLLDEWFVEENQELVNSLQKKCTKD